MGMAPSFWTFAIWMVSSREANVSCENGRGIRMASEDKLPPGVYRRKDSKILWIHYGYHGRDYRESAETDSPKKAAALRELRKAELRLGKFIEPSARRVLLSKLYAGVLE